jgi:hypothetical protein
LQERVAPLEQKRDRAGRVVDPDPAREVAAPGSTGAALLADDAQTELRRHRRRGVELPEPLDRGTDVSRSHRTAVRVADS